MEPCRILHTIWDIMQWCEVKYGICGELFINHFNAGNLSTHDWDEIGPLHRGTGICSVRIKKLFLHSISWFPSNEWLSWQTMTSRMFIKREPGSLCWILFNCLVHRNPIKWYREGIKNTAEDCRECLLQETAEVEGPGSHVQTQAPLAPDALRTFHWSWPSTPGKQENS